MNNFLIVFSKAKDLSSLMVLMGMARRSCHISKTRDDFYKHKEGSSQTTLSKMFLVNFEVVGTALMKHCLFTINEKSRKIRLGCQW